MLTAQLSHLHISKKNSNTLGVAPMAINLERCIKYINQLHLLADLALMSGDISNAWLIKTSFRKR